MHERKRWREGEDKNKQNKDKRKRKAERGSRTQLFQKEVLSPVGTSPKEETEHLRPLETGFFPSFSFQGPLIRHFLGRLRHP